MVTGLLGVLGLRNRVAFRVHFKPMSRLNSPFRLGVNGTFDIAVLSLVDSRENVKVRFAASLLSTNCKTMSFCNERVNNLLACLGTESRCFLDILLS